LYLCNTSRNIKVRDFFQLKKTVPSIAVYEHSNEDQLVAIGSYVLMPNHFHILVKEIVPGGVSKFMQKLQTAYTMYFNERNERSGALFQGRFKSQHVDNDTYLKYLYGYIHLNPLKLKDGNWKQNTELLCDYMHILARNSFSSYLDFAGTQPRPEKIILTPDMFPKYFTTELSHKKFIEDWIRIKVKHLY
jgi:putative transposase